MPAADPQLEAIRLELAEIKELLVAFTNDGLPLRSQLPSSELIASLAAAVALLLRDQPLAGADLQLRMQAAQALATELIRQSDAYQAATQRQQLTHLAEL
jgi:hypothetical protein